MPGQGRSAGYTASAAGRRIAHSSAPGVVAAIIDDLRVGEADYDVKIAGAELLEIRRLVVLDEHFVGLAAIQGVGLQPFFAARDAVGRRIGLDLVQTGVQVRNHDLARER